jgi:hypothetical protein
MPDTPHYAITPLAVFFHIYFTDAIRHISRLPFHYAIDDYFQISHCAMLLLRYALMPY